MSRISVHPRVRLAAIGLGALLALAGTTGCSDTSTGPSEGPTRAELIPADAVKVTPDTDVFVPVLQSAEWTDPVPMPGPVNTAGGEDSPFISPDGSMFLFWWTPDVSIPAENQVGDGGTGIWFTNGGARSWDEPTFVDLNSGFLPSLEGCPTLEGNTLWFCSIRNGNYGLIDVWLADYSSPGVWRNWRNAGETLNDTFDIGEWHVLDGGNRIIFGSDLLGGYGGSDLWSTWYGEGEWHAPENLGPNVNDAGHQSRPFVTPDGEELWFTGTSGLGYYGPAVFRCVKQGANWGPAEEIVSNYAAEPCLDSDGNLYFVHHFMDADEEMIEADIYVCYPR